MKISTLIDRFRKSPYGERIRIEKEFDAHGNGYFRKIGRYFKTAQILLFVLLFLFVTVFALANSERITYQNLYYFFKDFRTAVDNTDIAVDGIAYEIDENPSFSVFKGGLAVAGRERLQLLTASGGVNLSAPLDMANPKCTASTDLLLVYGMGETSYHIYNAFTKIHADTVDGAIRTANLSESGVYSIITDDDEYASAVYVYTRNFKKCNKYNLNSEVVAAPVSSNGKSIAILSYDVADGVYRTRLRLAEVGSERVYCDYEIDGEFPMGVTFTERDEVLLLTDEGLHSVTKRDGGALLEDLSHETVSAFSLDPSGVAIFLSKDGIRGGTLKYYNKNGEFRHTEAVTAPALTLVQYNGTVYCRTETEIVRLDGSAGVSDRISYSTYGGTLLVMSKDRVVCCFDGEAKYLHFDD